MGLDLVCYCMNHQQSSFIYMHFYIMRIIIILHPLCALYLLFYFLSFELCMEAIIQLIHAFVLKPESIEWNCCAPWKYWTAVAINLAFHCLNLHWFRLIV